MTELLRSLSPLADAAAGLLLTYLLHSTLLCGAALLVSLLLRQRALRLQEGLLRLALIGSVLTALLPLHLVPDLTPNLAPSLTARTAPQIRSTVLTKSRQTQAAPAVPAPQSVAPAASGTQLIGGAWPRAVVLVWLLGSVALLLRLGWALVRLRSLLAGRRTLSAGHARSLLGPLLPSSMQVHVTTSELTSVPLALGVLRPEICLPQRALLLSPELLRGALLHELGHVLRRDPAWLLGGQLLGALLWPQLLLILLRRRLHTLAEYLCDDFSARRTGRPLVLARCLTEVAGWLASGEEAAAVPGMLRAESELAQRVGRLISWDGRRDPMKTNAYIIPIGGLLLLVIAAGAPRFAVARPAAPPPPATPAAPAVPAAPSAAVTPPTPPTPPSVHRTPRAPLPPLPPAAPGAPHPPVPPVPPAPPQLAHDDTSSELGRKAAELAQAAMHGQREAMERLEREVEALAEQEARRATEQAAHAEHWASFGHDQPLPPPAVDGEAIRQSVRDALRTAREQARAARQAAREQARQAMERARAAAEQGADEADDDDNDADEDTHAAGQLQAERAKLQAERAQLQAERAQLQAERAQLESARRALTAPRPTPPQR